MAASKRFLRVSGLIVCVAISLIGFIRILDYIAMESTRNTAKEAIRKIEEFHETNGRLPENLKEIGIEERLEGPLFYDRVENEDYIIWFGTTLGESEKYESKTGCWQP